MAAIVVPSLALLALSWQSVERQRKAIDSLTLSNRLLATARLAERVEERVGALSGACLADPDMRRLAQVSGEPFSVRAAKDARELARQLVLRHPIAAMVFVTDASSPRYPLLQMPLPSFGGGLEDRSSPGSNSPRREFQRLLAAAERLEFDRAGASAATTAYRRAAKLASSRQERAMAEARLARCLTRTGRADEASRAWADLARAQVEDLDLANQPIGLVAAVELGRARADKDAHALVLSAYEALLSGRWVVGAHETEVLRCGAGRRSGPGRG